MGAFCCGSLHESTVFESMSISFDREISPSYFSPAAQKTIGVSRRCDATGYVVARGVRSSSQAISPFGFQRLTARHALKSVAHSRRESVRGCLPRLASCSPHQGQVHGPTRDCSIEGRATLDPTALDAGKECHPRSP